jgi:hypothetical protein
MELRLTKLKKHVLIVLSIGDTMSGDVDMKASIKNYRIVGTRVTVWDVLHHLEHHWSHQEIANIFRLSLEQVEAAVNYIRKHQEDVMDVHRHLEERNARGDPPEMRDKLAASHAKRTA